MLKSKIKQNLNKVCKLCLQRGQMKRATSCVGRRPCAMFSSRPSQARCCGFSPAFDFVRRRQWPISEMSWRGSPRLSLFLRRKIPPSCRRHTQFLSSNRGWRRRRQVLQRGQAAYCNAILSRSPGEGDVSSCAPHASVWPPMGLSTRRRCRTRIGSPFYGW